jgi:hypothetical protein
VLVDLAESLEGFHEDVEIVRVRDIANLADSNLDVLDKDLSREALRADLFAVV